MNGWYPHQELNLNQRFRKPFQALRDYTLNMRYNRTTTIQTNVLRLPVNLS